MADSRKKRASSSQRRKKLPPYVIEKPDGTWSVRRLVPTSKRDDKGRRIYVQIVRVCDPPTAAQAEYVLSAIDASLADDRPASSNRFSDFIEQFLKIKRSAVESKTIEQYDWLAKRFVYSEDLGSMDIDRITTFDLQRFYAAQQSRGASASMIRKLNVFLKMSFNQAILWKRIAVNPCVGLMLPKVAFKEIDLMAHDDIPRFAQYCVEHFPILAVAIETGMRPGELLALRWTDIVDARITVVRSVTFPKDGGFYFKDIKTKRGRRVIDISPTLSAMFGRLRAEHLNHIEELRGMVAKPALLEHKKVKGVRYARRVTTQRTAAEVLANLAKYDLIFASAAGTPRSPLNVNNRDMKRACAAIGIAPLSLYSLRHSCATLLLTKGVNVKAVSERLGHSGIQLTLDTYGHVLPPMRDDMTDALSSVLY